MRKNKPSKVSLEKKTNASVDGTTRKKWEVSTEREGWVRHEEDRNQVSPGTGEGQKREGKGWVEEGEGKAECE